jgi:hypothetical protein
MGDSTRYASVAAAKRLRALRYFLADTKNQLGKAREISHAKATIAMRLTFPFNIESDARVIATAEMDHGPVELHAILWDGGNGWQTDRMWWKFLPLPDPSPVPE